MLAHHLQQRDGDRIGLLARGTAGHPHANGLVIALPQQLGKDVTLQRGEDLSVAEETRDLDQNVGVELLDFMLIIASDRQVLSERAYFAKGHTPANAPLDRRRLVVREIDVVLLMNERVQFQKLLL